MINKTVLVVERDAEEAKKIVRLFKRFKFRNRIEIVRSKEEALDYIFATGRYADRKDHEIPGLILLDLLTNKTADVRLLKPLQAYLQTQTIPIVILTSSEEQEKELSDHNLGSIGFVRKPMDFTHLIEVIQRLGMKLKEENT